MNLEVMKLIVLNRLNQIMLIMVIMDLCKTKLLTSNSSFSYRMAIFLKNFILLVNRHDFIKHSVERTKLHEPEAYRAPIGEMDTTTSYSKEFVRKLKF